MLLLIEGHNYGILKNMSKNGLLFIIHGTLF